MEMILCSTFFPSDIACLLGEFCKLKWNAIKDEYIRLITSSKNSSCNQKDVDAFPEVLEFLEWPKQIHTIGNDSAHDSEEVGWLQQMENNCEQLQFIRLESRSSTDSRSPAESSDYESDGGGWSSSSEESCDSQSEYGSASEEISDICDELDRPYSKSRIMQLRGPAVRSRTCLFPRFQQQE